MPPTLIWDLPTRLFHWLLAAGFIAAAVIAFLLGEHSVLFPYHAIIGLTLGLMVCWRIVWGLVGSRHSRFGSFAFGPRAVAGYFGGLLSRRGKVFPGHNPGSAVAIFIMLTLVLGLAATGFMLGRGNEGVKEIHEVLAYAMVAVVIGHILGVALHTIVHRENLTAGMVHGRKNAPATDGIASSRPLAAAILLVLVGAWAFGLVRNFDAGTQTTKLPLVGTTLQVGEDEQGGGGRKSQAEHRRDHDD